MKNNEDDVTTNQTILYSLGIVAIAFCFFFLAKCTASVMATPEITQALQACNINVTYTFDFPNEGKNAHDFKVAPSPTPEVLKTVEQCREQVTKLYQEKPKTFLP